jgi:hypothetical protein
MQDASAARYVPSATILREIIQRNAYASVADVPRNSAELSTRYSNDNRR